MIFPDIKIKSQKLQKCLKKSLESYWKIPLILNILRKNQWTPNIMHSWHRNKSGNKIFFFFWIFRVLKYFALTSFKFEKSWVIKLVCKIDDLRIIKDILWICQILDPSWKNENNNEFFRLAYFKAYVKNLMKFIN